MHGIQFLWQCLAPVLMYGESEKSAPKCLLIVGVLRVEAEDFQSCS